MTHTYGCLFGSTGYPYDAEHPATLCTCGADGHGVGVTDSGTAYVRSARCEITREHRAIAWSVGTAMGQAARSWVTAEDVWDPTDGNSDDGYDVIVDRHGVFLTHDTHGECFEDTHPYYVDRDDCHEHARAELSPIVHAAYLTVLRAAGVL